MMTTPAAIGKATHPNSKAQTLRILSLSSVYPTPEHPGRGLFVRSRLQQMAALSHLTLVAPVPVVDYAARRLVIPGRRTPSHRTDSNLEVFHPGWFYPPAGGWSNAFALFVQILPLVRRLHRTHKFQLIDAHFGYPEGIAAALLAKSLRLPFTVTFRGCELIHGRYGFRRRCMSWALRGAARVITVSEELRKLAISMGADPAKVKVIANGVNSRVYDLRDQQECRRRLGIAPETRLILSAGHLVEEKGHHHVMRALHSLAGSIPDAQLWIAGGPGGAGASLETRLRRLSIELGLQNKVKMLGWVSPERLAEMMAAADVFCLASSREGWPNVVHEALSCGAPVVATRVGAVPDLVPSERYGLVIPVNDQPALENALQQALLRDWDRQAISAWGRARSWEEVGREVIATLGEVLDATTVAAGEMARV